MVGKTCRMENKVIIGIMDRMVYPGCYTSTISTITTKI